MGTLLAFWSFSCWIKINDVSLSYCVGILGSTKVVQLGIPTPPTRGAEFRRDDDKRVADCLNSLLFSTWLSQLASCSSLSFVQFYSFFLFWILPYSLFFYPGLALRWLASPSGRQTYLYLPTLTSLLFSLLKSVDIGRNVVYKDPKR